MKNASRTTRAATAGVLAAVCLLPAAAGAQIQPGRLYGPGEMISEPSAGLSLTIPDGWRGALVPDGSMFMLEPLAGQGAMFVIADQLTEEEARAEMSRPLDLRNGMVVTPSGEIREISTGHLSARYTVQGGPMELEGTVEVRLAGSGLGVAFILLSPPSQAPAHVEAMRTFALSLGVTEPATRPAASAGSDAWEPYLRGRYLARYYTASGYTESTELWLCSDGTFHFNDQAGGFGGGASGAVQGLGGGRWSATGAGAAGTLVLQWSSGERDSWALEYDYQQDRLYIEGVRWLRGNNERCS
jgi:hypothetical protein